MFGFFSLTVIKLIWIYEILACGHCVCSFQSTLLYYWHWMKTWCMVNYIHGIWWLAANMFQKTYDSFIANANLKRIINVFSCVMSTSFSMGVYSSFFFLNCIFFILHSELVHMAVLRPEHLSWSYWCPIWLWYGEPCWVYGQLAYCMACTTQPVGIDRMSCHMCTHTFVRRLHQKNSHIWHGMFSYHDSIRNFSIGAPAI